MYTDGEQRAAYNITQGRILRFVEHTCKLMGCEAIEIKTVDGCVTVFVELSLDIAIATFIQCLKRWTASWITGSHDNLNYWHGISFCAISPEDKDKAVAFVRTSSVALTIIPKRIIHHFILIASRNRVLIPKRHRQLLSDIASDTERTLDAGVIAASAMRNHIHLLCELPTDIAVAQFIARLKEKLIERTLASRSLRRVEDLSEDSIVYAVSERDRTKEEHGVADQDFIHSHRHFINEVIHLSHRLNYTYNEALQ